MKIVRVRVVTSAGEQRLVGVEMPESKLAQLTQLLKEHAANGFAYVPNGAAGSHGVASSSGASSHGVPSSSGAGSSASHDPKHDVKPNVKKEKARFPSVGAVARVGGLVSAAHFNGRKGVITRLDDATGRWNIVLDSLPGEDPAAEQTQVLAKTANLFSV